MDRDEGKTSCSQVSTKAITLHPFWCQRPSPPTLDKMENFVELPMRLRQLFKLWVWVYSVSPERDLTRTWAQ
jgi:hypothetical protein